VQQARAVLAPYCCLAGARAILALLLWLTSLYVLPANAACVVNFGERQCGPFEVQPAVIIKSALAKPGLQQALGRPVQQLAQLEGAGLYLLASDDPIVEAQRLSAQAYVHYAQPDVSQKRMLHTDLLNASAWPTRFYIREMSTKGAGVRIAIIDDGFDLSHEDLQGVDVGFSYDADHKTLGAGLIKSSWNSPVLMQPVADVIRHLAWSLSLRLGTTAVAMHPAG
jgi:subtilisin family serine protease